MEAIIKRFETLSDAIIGIVMTILVLEIKAPVTSADLPQFAESVSLFLISFVLIFNIWYRRTKFTLRSPITKLETFMLDVLAHGLLSLFPLAIKMLANYHDKWLPIIFYGLLNTIVMVILSLNPIIEMGNNWSKNDFSGFVRIFYYRRLFLTLASNLLILALASYFVSFGAYIYLLLPLADFLANFQRDKKLRQSLESAQRVKDVFKERYLSQK